MSRRTTGRARLLVAVVLIAGSIAAGVALALAPEGTADQRFRPDRTVTVALDPDEPLIVWSRSSTADVRCEIPGSTELVASDAINVRFHGRYEIRAGGETLHAVLDYRATPAGTYELACSGDATAVGEAPWRYRVRQNLFVPVGDTALALLIALPALLGVAILVWFLRRRTTGR